MLDPLAPAHSNKKKRKFLLIRQKIAAVQYWEEHTFLTAIEVVQYFSHQVPPTIFSDWDLRKWRRPEPSLMSAKKGNKSRHHGRNAKRCFLENELRGWVTSMRSAGNGVSEEQCIAHCEIERPTLVGNSPLSALSAAGQHSWFNAFLQRAHMSRRARFVRRGHEFFADCLAFNRKEIHFVCDRNSSLTLSVALRRCVKCDGCNERNQLGPCIDVPNFDNSTSLGDLSET